VAVGIGVEEVADRVDVLPIGGIEELQVRPRAGRAAQHRSLERAIVIAARRAGVLHRIHDLDGDRRTAPLFELFETKLAGGLSPGRFATAARSAVARAELEPFAPRRVRHGSPLRLKESERKRVVGREATTASVEGNRRGLNARASRGTGPGQPASKHSRKMVARTAAGGKKCYWEWLRCRRPRNRRGLPHHFLLAGLVFGPPGFP